METTSKKISPLEKAYCVPKDDEEKKLKKEDAQKLFNRYREFIGSIGESSFIIFRPLLKQPGYLKISRTAVEEIMKPEHVGGLGIAFGMKEDKKLTTMVGPLYFDNDKKECKLMFEENTIYDDLGQGDDPEGLIAALSNALGTSPENLKSILQANKLL